MSLLATPPAGNPPPSNPPPAGNPPPASPPPNEPLPPGGSGFSSLLGPDGNFAAGFTDKLPADLAEAKGTLENYKNPFEVFRALHNTKQLLGKKGNMVAIPNPDSRPEDVAAFRKAVGAPESADQYQLKPEKLPDGFQWSDEFGKKFGEIAFKHNAPNALMKELSAAYVEMEAQRGQVMAASIDAQVEKAREDLKREWGASFDINIGKAAKVAGQLGLDPNSPGFTDPEIVKAFVRLDTEMSEDRAKRGGVGTGLLGPEQKADAITNGTDPSVAHLHERFMKGDPEVQQMVIALRKEADRLRNR